MNSQDIGDSLDFGLSRKLLQVAKNKGGGEGLPWLRGPAAQAIIQDYVDLATANSLDVEKDHQVVKISERRQASTIIINNINSIGAY